MNRFLIGLLLLVGLPLMGSSISAPNGIGLGFENLTSNRDDWNDKMYWMTGVGLTINSPLNIQLNPVTPSNNASWPNGNSLDGSSWNSAFFFTGTGAFVGNPNSPNIPVSNLLYMNWLLNPAAAYFSSAGPVTITYAGGHASGGSGIDTYYVPIANPADFHPLFTGTSPVGSTAIIPGGVPFIIVNTTPCGACFSTFTTPPQYTIFTSSVPEPTPGQLISGGLGVLLLVFTARRRS